MARVAGRMMSLIGAITSLMSAVAAAQHYQADFPPEEFKARWAKVFDAIGSESVAAVQGAPLTNGFQLPRQSNTFYYLCGIETPGAYLVLDGRSRRAVLHLPPRNERLERAEGKVLSADDTDRVRALTGADEVRSTAAMTDRWPVGDGRVRAIYVESAPAEGYAQSRGELRAADAAIASDYWDGRLPRESHFAELLRTRHPRAAIEDLTPVLDELRSVKSPREIALVRRASQLAGLGLMEAMRSTEAGVFEYQLDAAARYVFLLNGARLDAYRSITASGTENINNMHYYRNSAELKDGDLVLMDYAPDYRYYVSDVGRVWPVNGRYLPWQRELLQFVLEYHKAVLSRIRPGVTAAQIQEQAGQAMQPVIARTRFSKPAYEQAARKLVDTGGGVFSHTVGMAVHDVGGYQAGPLKPGQVFSVDPQLRVPEENIYLRYEDTVVVTETGVENFTAFLPSELDEMEALVREKGIVQRLPALTSDMFERLSAQGSAKRDVASVSRGEPISFDVTGANLIDVIRLFTDVSGMNVVVYPGVWGRVTFKADEMPWDEALDRVLAAQGLGHRFEGNVLRIAKPEALGEAREYSGKPGNFDFQGETLTEIFQAFAPLSGAKVVVDPGVSGRVHAQLIEVPWDQALDVIVRTNSLDWRREGDLIRIVKPAPASSVRAEVRVADAEELQSAIRAALPGDTIVMKDGTWRDVAIVFDARATADAPVRLRAQTPGRVVLTGSSSLTFAAPHLVAEGLHFEGGALTGGAVVRFASDHDRLTESAIVDYNPADVKVEYHWVLLEGSDNRIDRCFLRGKTNRRPMISNRPGARRNRIEGCHFKDFPFVDENGRETIQIMGYGMSEELGEDGAFATVEGNLFEEAHGEGMEIISIKSNRNVIRGNTFRKTKGGVTNRSGNYNVIEGNVILGEGEPRSYGMRVTGQHHTVVDNHVENVDGPCLILVAGELIDKALTPDFQPLLREGTPLGRVPRYAHVKHGTFARNTFVDCGTPAVEIGSSYKAGWPQAQRVLLPEDNRIVENLISPFELGGEAVRAAEPDRAPPLGALTFRPNVYERNGEGRKAAPARRTLQAADVGPVWMRPATSGAAPAPSADRSPR